MSFRFNDIPIKFKMLGNAMILLLLLVTSALYALYAMDQISGEMEEIAERDIPLTTTLAQINEFQLLQSMHFERALRYGGIKAFDSSAQEQFDQSVDAFKQLMQQVQNEYGIGLQLLNHAVAEALNEAERIEMEKALHKLQEIEQKYKVFEQNASQVFELLIAGQWKKSQSKVGAVEQEMDELNVKLGQLFKEIADYTTLGGEQAREGKYQVMQILLLIAAVSLIVGIVSSWFFARNLVTRLSSVKASLALIAEGDLTRPIETDGKDELGKLKQSMQTMQDRLQNMISSIGSTSSELSAAAEQVSDVMTQTAGNMQQQQTETGQIAHAMSEMSQAVGEVAQKVVQTSEGAQAANDEAKAGNTVVQQTISGIEVLAQQIEDASGVISDVACSSDDITTVLDVIKGIAEQTNLLALNAAIEAARAGEQGRGFAVVADEVRTLAGRTQESTLEIQQIIEKLQSGAQKATQAMTSSREQSDFVVDKAKQAGSSLVSIADSVGNIFDMSTEIAAAAEQQGEVAKSMDSNIQQINELSQQNAASIEETAVAGQLVAKNSQELQKMVEQFRIR